MHPWDNTPERKGSAGRPRNGSDPKPHYEKVNFSIDPETFDRLEKYCSDEERARSWVVQKALRMWLESKGY